MPETIDKAVWLEGMSHVLGVISLLERIYETDVWTGALLFQDLQVGFLLVACFDPERYPGEHIAFEALFPARDLRDLTMQQACTLPNRYRPWLGGDLPAVLSHLKLLPT